MGLKARDILSTRGDAGRWVDLLAGGVPASEPAMRDQLFRLLLDWRIAMTAGSLTSAILWMAAARLSGADWPLALLSLDCLLALGRWRIGCRIDSRTGAAERARAVGWLLVLALVWALLLGTGVALCVASGDPVLPAMAIGVAAGVIGVMAFRNAPTPRHAVLLILSVAVPLATATFVAADGRYALIGIGLGPWCIVLFVLVRQNFRLLREACRARLELVRVARTDVLTGLPNRLAFNEALRDLTAGYSDEGFAVLYLDLDGFKAVNDRLGHGAGDALLVSVAARIRDATREEDAAYRLGGDEFALILTGARIEELDGVAERLIRSVSRRVEVSPGVWGKVGLSIGSARSDHANIAAREILRAADSALYQAKAQGRGRHVSAQRRRGDIAVGAVN